MNIITLTSDWGNCSHYPGIVKGVILNSCPDAKIIDISHDIPPFDIWKASFIMKNCYKHYPKGTIHIIGINSEYTEESPHICVEHDGHFFIGSDNGIFSLIFDNKPEKVFEINIKNETDVVSFSGRDVFAPAACHILQGKSPEELGKRKELIKQLFHPQPATEDNIIRGIVIFIDTYDNIITNVTQQIFNETGKGRDFNIAFRKYDEIKKLHKTYNEVPDGEMLAFFDSSGLLEIAINKGKASSLLGLKINDPIRILFENR